jgi:hypothetical protein
MGNKPDAFTTNRVLKFLAAGFALALFGVGVFVGMWALLGEAGMADFPRLIMSFCLPPALIAVIIGAFMLLTHRRLDEES